MFTPPEDPGRALDLPCSEGQSVVLWDWVTLTCQGSGTTGATTWYKDMQRLWQERQERFTVTESGTYWCDKPGTGRSPLVIVLQHKGGLGVPRLAPTLTPGFWVCSACLVVGLLPSTGNIICRRMGESQEINGEEID
uniref:Ig-like domain-containing protein n=1 Tax=Junco hyemalis TaxID=40217 RepID=A0A8C5IIA6_JUNHY